MKVAITCDQLFERDQLTDVVEAIADLFPKAEIFTVVHRPKAVITNLERRRIRSTYLSRFVKDRKDWSRWSFLIPGAAKGLPIPCSFDLVIKISAGMGHLFSTCDSSKVITYLFDPYELSNNAGISEKFFAEFLKTRSLKSLKSEESLILAKSSLQNHLMDGHTAKVISPPLKVEDFPFIKGMEQNRDYIVVFTKDLTPKMATDIKQLLTERDECYRARFIFVGDDEHLNPIKDEFSEKAFFGNRCHGELAPLLSGALGSFWASGKAYPKEAIYALSAGRPVLAMGGKGYPGLLGDEGVFWTTDESWHDGLLGFVRRLKIGELPFQSERLHGQVAKYNTLKFKHAFKRVIDSVFT